MNEVTDGLQSKECDCCKKGFNDFKLLIGVYYQDMQNGEAISIKKRTLLCPECFSKLDKSPSGMGVIGENGIKPINFMLK